MTEAAIVDAPAWFAGLLARGDDGYIELRYGVAKTRKVDKSKFIPVSESERLLDAAGELAERWDVFAGVCVRGTRGRSSDDVTRANLLWADLDNGRELLDRLPLRPTLIVASGTPGHLQAFWKLKEPADLTDANERAELERIVKGVQRAVGSDPVSDPARIMRVPGTLNWKHDPPTIVTPIEFDPALEYNLSDFEMYLPHETQATRIKPAELPEARQITLSDLNVSRKIVELIADGWHKGNGYPSRSEADMAVANALVAGGHNDAEIRGVFQHYPIGAKFREKGNGPRYLALTIQKARQLTAQDTQPQTRPRTKTNATLDDVVSVFQKYLYLPDPGAIKVSLAAVAANKMQGDPIWVLHIGPPGHTKTELLQPFAGLDIVHPAATLTEPALLSGTARREVAKDAKGGLLREIGDFGIILCKDFGSVLNMHREQRAATLAALREIYDGSWTRHVGVDGGRSLSWSGKVGLLAGCTPAIDRHHAVMGSMGERFILYRVPHADEDKQAARALKSTGHEYEMREELRCVVVEFFASLTLPAERPPLTDDEQLRLIALTRLVVRARSAVERDGYTREIELVPGAEAPTRMVKALALLFAGLLAIGEERGEAWRLVRKAAVDSVPALRWNLVERLLAKLEGQTQTTRDLATAADLPTKTVHRALEELAAYGLAIRTGQGDGRADLWEASPLLRTLHARAMATETETSED